MSQTDQSLAAGVCDLESGLCALPGDSAALPDATADNPVPEAGLTTITYVTDPICSACWILEPAWRSLTERYRDLIDVRHVYGGLLRGWQGFHDAGNGIRRPEDVAHHWDEFARISGQPINSSVWWSDPIDSSYPPSIALAAVRQLAPEHEEAYLRRLREELFLDGRNIAASELLETLVVELGLDVVAYRRLIENGEAESEFERDLVRTHELGARGFPTLILEGPDGRVVLHGWIRPDRLEDTFLTVSGATRRPAISSIDEATDRLGTGTSLEYAALTGHSVADVEELLTRAGAASRPVGKGRAWSPKPRNRH
ncbi:DsbA family protein [Streptomyces aureus]|uniref:DsbA family protein n=1 Tax=Streptomyces aureus TaxID=193461 RepID=UPI00068D56BE|nr:DsbA family protein [Streptomyces aureus]